EPGAASHHRRLLKGRFHAALRRKRKAPIPTTHWWGATCRHIFKAHLLNSGSIPLSEHPLGRRANLAGGTVFAILTAISYSHFLNDRIQSLRPAIYPLLKSSCQLSFVQIGLITLTFQLTASILQPVVGYYTDRHPRPYSLAVGMGSSLCGLLLLAVANHFYLLLLAAALIGTGSSIFHPESSRVARLASGGRHGFAQSFFQVGGNIGSSIGPLLAAFIVVPYGQRSIAIFSLIALLAIFVLWNVGRWYRDHLGSRRAKASSVHADQLAQISRGRGQASAA